MTDKQLDIDEKTGKIIQENESLNKSNLKKKIAD